MIQIVGSRLCQWDVGRSVSVSDSKATHVHLANQGDSKAPIIEIKNGEAKIPDYLLQTGKTLHAYAVLDGVTLESKSFAVCKRERPENYVYQDDQRNYIYDLITNAENAAQNANLAAQKANEAAEKLGSVVIPTKVSQLENDSNFLTEAVTSVNGKTGDITLPTTVTVTVTKQEDGSYGADKTVAELSAAKNAGETLRCWFYEDNVFLPLTEYHGMFTFSAVVNQYIYQVTIRLQGASETEVLFTKTDLSTGGADGITPHIGDNGNWWIGEEDTGVSASASNDQIKTTVDEYMKGHPFVKTVNGIAPDENGNVEITTSGSEQNIGHPLAGKRLSIIGDSISTFSGYIPDGYEAWYPKNYVDTVEKTWWHQLIQNTGMVLCKNASWSGSTLCGSIENASGIVGCSDARVEAASDEYEPDIIIVFIGINDFAKSNGYSCGEYDGSSAVTANTTVTSITDAYGLLLSKLRVRYPNAFICGCRIMPEKYSGGSMNASFSSGFPNVNPDDSVSLSVLNKRIEEICKVFGCGVIPMDASGISFYNVADCTGDGLHPNEVQMSRMALVAEKWLALYAGEHSDGSVDDGSDNEKDEPTPTSISASYSGSNVAVGTNLTDLTDIVVTAHYSDGTTEIVTDYALSGEIAEGENIIVVTYEGLTTTFIVTGVANDRTILYNWDFTKSLTDSVSGATATPVLASGKGSTAAALPIQDNTGVHFIGGGQALDFGSIFALNRTYEIDVAEMDYKGPSGKNVRFFTLWQGAGSSTVSGFLYRGGTGAWCIYNSPSWGTAYSLTSPNDISGKTVKLKIASNGACELFLDNVSYGFGGRSFTADWNVLELGSSAMDSGTDCGNIGANLYNCTITGFRIYEGVD